MQIHNLDILVAPKIRQKLELESADQLSSQGQSFPIRNGILYLLPDGIENQEIKEREREGWKKVFEENHWNVNGEQILALPGNSDNPYWVKANAAYQMVLAALHPLNGKRGLDVACGLGWGAANFAKLGAKMIAADFNDTVHNGLGAAILVRNHGINFDAVCSDCEYLPIADSSLDFVFICSALHHFTRPEVALAEIYRVLKPGGVLADICESFKTGYGDEEREAGHKDLNDFRAAGINEQSFTHSEYLRMFRSVGFHVETILPDWDKADSGKPLQSWVNKNLDEAAKVHHRKIMRYLLGSLRFGPLVNFLRWRRLNYTVSDRIYFCTKQK